MKRSIKYEANALLSVFIVAVIFIFIMVFAEKYPKSWDLTKNKVNTLSQQTQNIVKELKNPVKVTAFYQASADKNDTEAILKKYADLNKNFTYEFVDPNKSVERAAQYDVTMSGVVFFESGDKRERVRSVGEEGFTSAIIALSKDTNKNISQQLKTEISGYEQKKLPRKSF